MPRRPRPLTLRIANLNAAGRYALALVIVAMSAGGAEGLARLTHSTRVGGILLVGVLVTSYLAGSGPGYLAAATAFLLYNAFVGPLNSRLDAYSAEDALVLVLFLLVAMLMGNLTGRLRDEAKGAAARARATAVLFEATREFSATNDVTVIRTRLADHLATAARGRALVLGDAREVWSGEPPPPMVLSAARARADQDDPVETVEAAGWSLRSLGKGGVAGWTSDEASEPGEEALVEILADAGAAAVSRAELARAKSEAEARARTEDLRNALLSSISHDLRTPLAAVLASATSLQEFGDRFDAGTRRDLVTTIQEEAERLNAFVSNLLNMTRLEAGALDAHRAPFDLGEVVERTRMRFERMRGGRIITWRAGDAADQAVGDPVLFEVALGNVLENAVRYSPEGATISMASARRDGEVVVTVADEGPGASVDELERLFDKFYRGAGAKHLSGTGLGLSIVRGVMQGMGGSVKAEIRADATSGLVVSLALPLETG